MQNNYLTSISSYRKIDTYSRWDGDGTAAAAIDMSEDDGARPVFSGTQVQLLNKK